MFNKHLSCAGLYTHGGGGAVLRNINAVFVELVVL